MTLDEYLWESRLTLAEFSKRLGYNQSYVSQVKNGVLPVSKKMRYLVEKETQGKVKM